MSTFIFTIKVEADTEEEAREYIMDSTDFYVGFAKVEETS